MRLVPPALLLSLLVLAAPIRAQSIDAPRDTALVLADTTKPSTDGVAAQPTSAGPSMTGLRAAVHQRETARSAAPSFAGRNGAGLGQARAMMIVGAAAFVTGAMIGDQPGTIIMVGGAVIGLIGLYEYLQ
ncbi:MAG TPA: hypothetical protein VIP11_05110 [Gemmatimonadaceae bacterium]